MVVDQELAANTIDTIQILIDAVLEAKHDLEQEKLEEFQILGMDINQALFTVKQIAGERTEACFLELFTRCRNCLASLKRIFAYVKEGEIEKAERKLEFELLPLLRLAQIRFYYFGIIEGEKEREQIFWEEEAVELCKNYYAEQASQTGHYKYDVTVYVLAYNNLDYTKLCVESVLENIPRTLRCELILVNHGSTDGTKEYFESIQPEKQVDIKVNSFDGFWVAFLIAEGEFIVNVSNDVVIGKNAIELMVQCMKEDRTIGYIVPATPNISNLQAVLEQDIKYETLNEFKKKAEQYNKRNRKKEECRVRLLSPIYTIRTEDAMNSQNTKAIAELLLHMGTAMFGDDAWSLYFRRAGYKNILMKDVYCHHFGSKTVGTAGHDYLSGRKKFYQLYGVDAWEKGFCWSFQLFQKLVCEKADTRRILGINDGMGSNSLKIKEELKERTGNTEIELVNYTMESRFLADLCGISDRAYFIKSWEELFEKLRGTFDYILVSGGLERNQKYKSILHQLERYLIKDGVMIVQSSEKDQIDWFERQHMDVERMEYNDFLCCQDQMQVQYGAFCKNIK